jgi:aminodeoxychorismate synthase, component I, bacterial clade
MNDTVLAFPIPYRDPAAAFTPLAGRPFAVLLDSAGGETDGWSFLASDPFRTLVARGDRVLLDGRPVADDPLNLLAGELARWAVTPDPDLPPLQTGAVGWLGYDLVRRLERIPPHRRDDMGFPDLALGFCDVVACFHRGRREGWILSSGHPERTPATRERRARRRAAWLKALLDDAPRAVAVPPPPDRPPVVTGNLAGRDDYLRRVETVLEHIRAGDIYQANFTHRLATDLPPGDDPWSLYLRLRARTPAPFAAFVRVGDLVLASASPERFLLLRGDRVETRPIKGTRPRGADPAADAELAAALRASGKDRAENVMIVDLLRNDLGRACRPGSVVVPDLCALESHPTVHHLVSTVTGRLRPGLGAVDLLRAAFPGGSVTGAPKIRAMEIIADLEPTARGPYTGSIGYLSAGGDMDTSIVIRTFCLRGRRVTLQTGGGIVADSDPAAEWEESLLKARALLDALAPGTRFTPATRTAPPGSGERGRPRRR